MKHLFLALAIICCGSIKAQTPKTINAKLDKATVYLQGAHLYYTENVNLRTGVNKFAFENISPYINQASIQAGIKSGVVMDMKYELTYEETKPKAVVLKKYEHEIQQTGVKTTGLLARFGRIRASNRPRASMSDVENLTPPADPAPAARKRKLLIEHYGEAGFDYAGNSRPDLHIFDAARQAIVVAPDRAAGQWARDHNADLIGKPKTGRRTVVKMLRVHQWLKNTLIAVPVILSHEYFNAEMVLQCLVAFVAFSATASAIYIINDFFDLPLDRQHATKRNRPFASGALSIPFGLKSVAVLLAVAVGAASLLDPLFWLVLGGYLIATTAYSLALKRMLLIDVLTLAGLYTVRILAGAAATGTGVSFWLLAFSVFFFLSLALVKRFVELKDTDIEEGKRLAGRGYRREDFEVISQAGLGAGFAAVLVLALYIDSDAVKAMYATPWLIWPLAPLVLYIILRIWVLARRGEMHEDPVVFIMRDWRSQMMAGLGAMMLLIAVWAGPWA